MDWEQVTIIAQIATGVATLAVAVFLASQLRIQHRDSERDFVFVQENKQQDLIVSIFGDEATGKLWWKATSDWDSLSDEETNRFRFLYQQFYLGSWTAWRMRRDGDNLDRYSYQWRQLLERPGQRRYYERFGRDILQRDQSLLNFVENVYQELEAEQNA
jgi:hypothetical protein